MAIPRRMLVPVDFTEGSLAALRKARELATMCGSHVHVLHVVPRNDAATPPMDVFGGDLGTVCDATSFGELDRLATLIARERLDPFTTTGVVRRGRAGEQIARYAREIDASLIVMGLHGDAVGMPPSVGQVNETVIGSVRCPVLAIPAERVATTAQREGAKQAAYH